MARIEELLGGRAAVFQLPIIPYPEAGPREDMVDYDLLKGYLHSQDLRWSYGAVRGRPRADWQRQLEGEPAPRLVRAVAAIGFDGIWIDRFGWADRAVGLEADLGTALDGSPLVSDDGRLALFDLRPYAAGLERELGSPALDRIARAHLGTASPLRPERS